MARRLVDQSKEIFNKNLIRVSSKNMRIATFNLESLDLEPKAKVPIDLRIEMLRPQLLRLNCDILCLQEVNGQKLTGCVNRQLVALDMLLENTPYSTYYRISTGDKSGEGVSDIHNLVILSQFPIVEHKEIFHEFLKPQKVKLSWPANKAQIIKWDRPILHAKIKLENDQYLHVFNVHFRAPLATPIVGQKLSPFVWKSVSGWAEGYYLAELKRSGQALELRLALEGLLLQNNQQQIIVCGDFNAEDHDAALKIVIASEEDTGNGALANHVFTLLDRSISVDRRYSILHHARPQMVDHILVNRSMLSYFKDIEVHNETLADELLAFSKIDRPPDSFHAPVVAEFTSFN